MADSPSTGSRSDSVNISSRTDLSNSSFLHSSESLEERQRGLFVKNREINVKNQVIEPVAFVPRTENKHFNDPHTRDYMMDRFLPAVKSAKSIASEAPQYDSRLPPVSWEHPAQPKNFATLDKNHPAFNSKISSTNEQSTVTQGQVNQLMTYFNSQLASSNSQAQHGYTSSVNCSTQLSYNSQQHYGHTSAAQNFPSCNPNIQTSHTNISGMPFTSFTCLSALEHNNKPFETSWIIDTGATDHMTNSLHNLTHATPTINLTVKLPNGTIVPVTHIGTVIISKDLTLNDVLCVPSFGFNLLSVSKLTQTKTCCFLCFHDYCFIQDFIHWKMIGLGKRHGGLYFLSQDTTQPTNSVNIVTTRKNGIYDKRISSVK